MKRFIASLLLFFCFVTLLNAQSYLGYVTKQVNFRTQSNTSCKVISSLQPGTALFVVSKQKINGFYTVLNIETDQEGFVHANYVQLDKILPKNENGIFTPIGKISQDEPIIKIHNDTELKLTLKLNSDLYTFSPQERKVLVLPPGSYTYRASAPGVLPDHGVEKIQGNYEYKWSFYVATAKY